MKRLVSKEKLKMAKLLVEKNGADLVDDIVLKNLKLGQLEDIEEELGIDLITLFKALKEGVYYKTPKYDDKNETIRKAYNCRVGVGIGQPYITCDTYGFDIKDYGKTWALTKSELTNE